MAKLFTRFDKLQRTAAINSEGIGLGLTIVQQIVKAAEGSVHVDSPGVGQGSTFTFTMHMNQAQSSSNSSDEQADHQ